MMSCSVACIEGYKVKRLAAHKKVLAVECMLGCTVVPRAAYRMAAHKTGRPTGFVVALSVRVVKDPFSMLAMLASKWLDVCTTAQEQ